MPPTATSLQQPWKIELLGRFCARNAERVVTRFRTQKTGLLLAYLAFYGDRPHPKEQLMELLWPECEPSAGRNSLSQALSSLRHQLEPPGVPQGAVLQVDRTNARLNPDAVSTDVNAFERAIREASRCAGSIEELAVLERAIGNYGGDLLPGYYEDWNLTERERLTGAFSGALNRLILLLDEAGRYPEALEHARTSVAADPLNEEAQRGLIRLLIAAGQPAAAVRQYQIFDRLLQQEMGVAAPDSIRELVRSVMLRAPAATSPSDSTADKRQKFTPIVEEISAGPSPSRRSSEGKRTEAASAPNRGVGLPMRFTRFFGREREIARLQAMCEDRDVALITLTGPGGTGKTRLAIEVARRIAEEGSMPVCFTPLADVEDPSRIAETVRDTLRLARSTGDPLDQVLRALGGEPHFLVLDNFEQLVDGGDSFVETIRRQCPHLTILATSRRRIGLEGEREFPVGALPRPEPEAWSRSDMSSEALALLAANPSIQLFVDRAQASRADFQLTPRNAAAVAKLCERMEYLPLAIELAAAQSQVFAPAQMLAHLDRSFDFLESRRGKGEARHRSLRAAMEWSYRLLNPDLQGYFANLTIFRGTWTAEAAAAIVQHVQAAPKDQPPQSGVAAAVENLALLRESSLLIAEEAGDTVRFRMLETLREFGKDRVTLDDWARLSELHAAHYLALAEDAVSRLTSPAQAEWLERLELEHENLRALLDWSECGGDTGLSGANATHEDVNPVEVGLRTAAALTRFWAVRGYLREGRRRLESLLAHAVETDVQPAVVARAHDAAGKLASMQGDYAAAYHHYEEGLAIYRAVGDKPGTATVLSNWGVAAQEQEDFSTARVLLVESLDLRRAGGSPLEIAASLHNLAWLDQNEKNYDQAAAMYAESLAAFRAIGDRTGIAAALNNLGSIAYVQNDLDAAMKHHRETLSIRRELADRPRICGSLGNVACVAGARGDHVRALRLFGAAEAIREAIGFPVSPHSQELFDVAIERSRMALDECAASAAWAEGRAMNMDAAVAYALAEDAPA